MEDFIKLYDELGAEKIDSLYEFSCLKATGFEDEKAYKLISLLHNLWLKDENNYGISKLSDMLYEVEDEIDDEMTIREILSLMYEKEYFNSNDEEGIF